MALRSPCCADATLVIYLAQAETWRNFWRNGQLTIASIAKSPSALDKSKNEQSDDSVIPP
jgi:hypothetical protein